MQDNEKKPALRFKGFTDPWEQRKLGEIAKEVVRNDPVSDAPIMMITAGFFAIDFQHLHRSAQ